MIESLTRAAKALQLADYVMYSSGAGMGVDSGLPDFRGNEGFWNNYPPYKNKFNFMECANPQFLESNPTLFWGFYGHRLNTYR
jgi:NAD-dependent SIR2 family protein deacetylase